MRTEKCEKCGMSDYERKNGADFCTYCGTRYEDKPAEPKQETALQSVLNFTERQIDKYRETKKEMEKPVIPKTEEEKKAEAKQQKKRAIIAGIILVTIFLLAVLILILDKQGVIDLSDSTETAESITTFINLYLN